MAPTNPRKRAAPGSSQADQMPQSYTAPAQVSNADFLDWNQPENTNNSTSFNDQSDGYNMSNNSNSGGAGGMSQAPNTFDQAVPTASTQLARRPNSNRQLVQTANRMAYDKQVDPWGQFGDDSILDTQNGSGVIEENDNIELLEERAAVAKRDAQSKRKQIPPFVQKLSSFLDESKNTELIRWSDRGDSFVVLDEDEFAKTLIPELFKHNNYASFVRQLNMYGFHKRVGLSDNSMKASERKNKSPSEYYNPYFKRGHPNLLWLINKPKGGNAQKKKSSNSKVKNEEVGDGESDDDGREIEEVYGNNVQQSRAISAAPEAGPLQRRDVAALQNQLAEIQKQQGNITSAIARLRKDHNQLYQQSVAFQSLHDRHENSISAILTFLATVYNRSLDGQGPQNIAQMFTSGINHNDPQPHGSVVDIGDVSNQQEQKTGSMSPHRRPQRLLMAPLGAGAGRAATASPSTTPTPQSHTYQRHNLNAPHAAMIEELFDAPTETPQEFQPDRTSQHQHQRTPSSQNQSQNQARIPQSNMMMNIIQDTNAQTLQNPNSVLQFPEMLSHYENSNGNSPLTNEQRNSMLNLMAHTSSASNSNNALTSPTPPPQPSLEELGYTQGEIENLLNLQVEQTRNINEVKATIAPLSPSGSVPGLEGDTYFSGMDATHPSDGANLDLDQYLDTGAFYTGSSPMAMAGNGDYGYDIGVDGGFGDGSGLGGMGGGMGLGESHFDMGMDGAADSPEIVAVKVESLNSSAAHTPEGGVETPEDLNGMSGGGDMGTSPSKKRRKN
ncbi:related to heat shock transcription factor [Rhynchosporium secalis]|uniref:Related to heat shock transcription factor n=1 Tax=Rhynchosporium secalis TaxID=38038 RepID=A0A1E1MIS9_RHYSE|nr:related to heat shock transcription factor [Rhynchosporium secalis]